LLIIFLLEKVNFPGKGQPSGKRIQKRIENKASKTKCKSYTKIKTSIK